MTALKQGGTGSRSEHEEQPEFLPDKYESGTPNAVGLAGLNAGLDWIMARGVKSIRQHEMTLGRKLMDGLREISGVTVYGPPDASLRTAVVAFNIAGLQLADLIAHPSCREILLDYKLIADDRDIFGDKICIVLRDSKYLRSRTGQIQGYGKKLLP